MANQSEKKRDQQNRLELMKMLIIALISHAIFFYVAYLRRPGWEQLTWKRGVVQASTSLGIWGSLWMLRGTANSGADLCLSGALYQYYFDLIYISVLVQLGTLYSNLFYLAYAVVAIFLGYKLWTGIIVPLFLSGSSNADGKEHISESERKRRERERRFNRGGGGAMTR